MKKIIAMIAALAMTSVAFGQLDAEKMEIGVGGTFGKPKIIPRLTRLSLPQIRVFYKVTTTARSMGKESSTNAQAAAKIKAVLETTDRELNSGDFQEITDYFFSYFQKKLKENGIDTVAWGKIAATDFYQNGSEKSKDKTGDAGSDNVYYTSIAHNGNLLYGGFAGFAFGKGKKATNFCEELQGPAFFLNLTVDFADLWVGVKIKTDEHVDVYKMTVTRHFKYDAYVASNAKVIPTNQHYSMVWNEKSQAESLVLRHDLTGIPGYAEHISEDPSRMKNNPFRFAKEMVPVVIETTTTKYKDAAKKALEKYADAFIVKATEQRKGS